jgi:hypothetical protein
MESRNGIQHLQASKLEERLNHFIAIFTSELNMVYNALVYASTRVSTIKRGFAQKPV